MERMDDGRTRVRFENGEDHRYKPSSIHKLKLAGRRDRQKPPPRKTILQVMVPPVAPLG